jgi:hypothetical protein
MFFSTPKGINTAWFEVSRSQPIIILSFLSSFSALQTDLRSMVPAKGCNLPFLLWFSTDRMFNFIAKMNAAQHSSQKKTIMAASSRERRPSDKVAAQRKFFFRAMH